MSEHEISVNKYWLGFIYTALVVNALGHLFGENKSDLKKEMLKSSKPLTEKVIENKITLDGDTVKTERLDTVAFVIPANKFEK